MTAPQRRRKVRALARLELLVEKYTASKDTKRADYSKNQVEILRKKLA